jgi:OPT family oligopeptide transporter
MAGSTADNGNVSSDTISEYGPGVPPLPENATNEQKDAHWLRYVYKGDQMPQLTPRAIIMGGLLGMIMAASNLYTTLAIGWAFGVAITASVMAFAIWNGARKLSGNRLTPMSILETNCMASTASAAGYSTGSTIATMFGALLLLTVIPEGKEASDIKTWDISPWWLVAAFTFCTGMMGVFLAIPMKRQMINHEQLRFPSGVAAAETLRKLYSESKEALTGAYVLLLGMAAGFVVGVLNTARDTIAAFDSFFDKVTSTIGFSPRLPEQVPAEGFTQIQGKMLPAFGFEPSVLLIAAGIITRLRVCLSMLAGSALLYFVVGPMLVQQDLALPGSGWVALADATPAQLEAAKITPGTAPAGNITHIYDKAAQSPDVVRNIDLAGGGAVLAFTRWSLWGGTAVMVFASLTALAMQWPTLVRAFTIKKDTSEGSYHADAAARKIEVPLSWMVIGMVPLTIAMVIVQYVGFGISWWAGLIAVAMSFVLSLVASRATGETDTTPIGAMGKVMQLTFAVIAPNNVTANLASAGVAANSAIASADLLMDLKSGYLLGANPRKQFLAQFGGVFFGTLAIVIVWYAMVPDRATLDKFAAPATRQWAAVAEVLTQGIDKLPNSARLAIVIGAIVGIMLPVLERLAPKNLKPYMPSAMGIGLSWVVPFGNALGFAIGAVIGKIWELGNRRSSDLYAVAIASGLIAGESLTKAFVAVAATAIKFFGSGTP